MANILYGVNGEGSGHSSRAREVIVHLEAQGHRVHVASFDRGYRNLKDDFKVTEIDGLRLAYLENRVRYRKTVLRNLVHLPKTAHTVHALGKKAADWQLDLVITDYEPITCHVGHKLKLPIIAIDNQHLLTDAEITYPPECRKEAAAAKLVTRLMTPRADAYLAISFFKARLKKKTTFLFPPILRAEVLRTRPTEGDAVLAYVTSNAADLLPVLRSVRQKFVCYGFERVGTEGNVDLRKPSLDGFLRDLANCRAIVANAGFSLISEALYLGKPYLAWPVKRQFEQVFNAYYIVQMGFGAYWDDLNKERVESFLFNLENYREKLAGYERADNSALFRKLDELIARFTQ